MSVAVKICGITSAEAADAAITAGAAYGGLVFHLKSPRFVTPQMAAALAQRMRGRLKVVALVVDLDDDGIEAVIRAARPDVLQLHGRESVGRVAALRSRFGLPVIKSLAVAESADLAVASAYETVADMLLFDACAPLEADRPGGHGAAFDWKILSGRSFTRPWLLAGGLTPGNIARAIALSGAKLVDVSSGVETAPGIKSPARIAEFIAAAREEVRA
ncbi:MAG TPA: phosphoribosylanthranilate isomerase [Rhizomicrobium sp.]|jgi:phosphoribosylanthranilate isomerase|nr:phosphoribosylanthranilate isomerase [Rhizomicrobium sp.]